MTVWEIYDITGIDPWYLYRIKEIVEAESLGAIQVDLFPAGQLGGERELIESTKLGTIQMSMVSGAMAGFYKPAMVLDIPYLFPSAAVAWNVLDGEYGRDLANDILKNLGTRVLAYGETGFRNFTNSKHTIKSPADMKGLKLRVMETPLYMTLVKSLGANPTPIAWPETYSALQQKVVDGQENPVSVIATSKFWEVQKYMTMTNHQYNPQSVIFSKKIWDALSPAERKILDDSANEATKYQREQARAAVAVNMALLKKNGMTVSEFAPAEVAKLRDKMKPVIAQFSANVGDETVKEVQAELAKMR